MAHRKRSRVADDVGSAEVEVESASSSFRHSSQQKRPRIALARANGGSVVSDDESDDDAIVDETDMHFTIPSEDEDDEADELRATQVVEKQMRQHGGGSGENLASEQGVIEEVFCRNFMCHTKLRVKLGPNINFIIGHNGSGKSAVLTALTMCLGGKATATNRGASLKSLIKEGEENATLAVKIKNRGEGAYKPDLYGDSIIIERHFSRSGTSGFKIKNEQDRTISSKKSDLDDILDFFAFQLDNPINVLTQDMARQFLSNSSPTDKYKFFIRGTQLEMLDADYKLLEEHLDNIEAKLSAREEDVEELRQKAVEAEQRKKKRDQMASLEERIRDLQRMHAWAQVEEAERDLESWEEKTQERQVNVNEKKERAQDTESILEGHTQALDAAKRTQSEVEERRSPLEDNRNAEKEIFDEGKSELSNLLAQERQIKEQMRAFLGAIKQGERQIEEEKTRLADAEGPEHIQRLHKLEQLRGATDEAKHSMDEHVSQRRELEQNRTEASRNLEPERAVFEQATATLRQAREQLTRTMKEQPKPYAAYRPNMANLVRAINGETRWRFKPVGPMGAYIRLKDQNWMSQIEKTFGGVLEGFVVTCKEDESLLSQIMRKANCNAPIFIGSSAPLDTTGKEPEGDVKTILRILDIDNHAVRNQLIINQGIDQTVLIESREEAYRFMYQSERPRNVKATICFSKERRKGVRFEFTRMGEEKSGPVDAWNGLTRMKSDHEADIRLRRQNVETASRDEDAAKGHVKELEAVLRTANQNLIRHKDRLEELRIEFQRAEDEAESLQNEIDNNRPQDGRLHELERQLTDAKAELEGYESSYQDCVNAKDDRNAKQREIKARLDSAQEELNRLVEQISKAQDRVKELDSDCQNARRENNLAHEQIKTAEEAFSTATARRDREREGVEYMVGKAQEVCPRVPVETGMTPIVIDNRLEKLIKDMQARERDAGGTRQELTMAYYKAYQEFQEAESQMKSMGRVASDLKKTLAERQTRWKQFRRFITVRARVMFAYLLSERQFRGRVLMDHTSKELDIKVEPDLTKVSDSGREAKTLSGGEKSFSTICLLLAIWEAMGSPIRCLDEFDVFMDSVNRATSMTMMIQAARRAVGRQFILITPQAMNNVQLGPDVRIHKMSDPERGQQTLAY